MILLMDYMDHPNTYTCTLPHTYHHVHFLIDKTHLQILSHVNKHTFICIFIHTNIYSYSFSSTHAPHTSSHSFFITHSLTQTAIFVTHSRTHVRSHLHRLVYPFHSCYYSVFSHASFFFFLVTLSHISISR